MTKAYAVAPITVKLGTVLDATIAHGRKRTVVDEWRGFQLLTGEAAFDQSRPRLYLVRGRLGGDPGVNGDKGAETYSRWHKREPRRVGELNTQAARYPQGRMVRIGYRSDKWSRRGTTADYDHDFLEDGGSAPLVYTNTRTLAAATTIVVVGGSMRITEAGID